MKTAQTKSLKTTFFPFMTLLLMALSMNAFAQNSPSEAPVVIREIQFRGLETITPEQALAKIQTQPGMLLDRERLREDLKRLAPIAWNWPEVRSEEIQGGVRLIFILKENPTLDSIHIIGNVRIPGEQLRKAIRVKPGDILTRNAVEKARATVAAEYRGRGYLRADIQAELVVSGTTDKPAHVLQILVDEGRKVRVDDLIIEGNKAFSNTRLRTVIETSGSWLFIKNYFDPAIFEDDMRNLRHFYQSRGYFDASVVAGKFEEDEAAGTITPRIIITEGERYKLAEVRVIGGGDIFSTEEIAAEFRHLEGKPFDADAFNKAIERVRNTYANAGFVTTEIQENFAFQEGGRVVATLTIDEKAKVKVGRILVQRSSWELQEDASWFAETYYRLAPPVDDQVIMENIVLESGNTYERRDEIESESKLRKLGIFDNVEIESRSTNDPTVRDVIVNVQEGVTGRMMVGVGYAESLGAYAWGRYTERNLFGQADALQANLLIGTEAAHGSLRYLDRQIGDTDLSLDTELRHIQARRPGYRESNTGISAELGKPLDEFWTLYLKSRLEYVRLDEGTYDPIEDFDVDYPVATLALRAVRDARKYDELNGNFERVIGGHIASAEIEGGYADGGLVKLSARYHQFHQFSRKIVFSSDWRLGLMPMDALDIGPTERFYMGGTNDLRGFSFRRAGVHDAGDDDVPLGGATKILSRNELLYSFNDTITGLAFFDGGMLATDAFDTEDPRFSTGLGLRIHLRKIEAGVDLAVPINAGTDDEKRYFHIIVRGRHGF